MTVSEETALQVFKAKIDKKSYSVPVWRPIKYIKNNYEDLGNVVVDHATELMWQKSGSNEPMVYENTKEYIEELNRQKVVGYDDWWLPTIPELMPLLEPEKQSNGLYINPIFDKPTESPWYWSANTRSSGLAWHVGFYNGHVDWRSMILFSYVRGVRSRRAP